MKPRSFQNAFTVYGEDDRGMRPTPPNKPMFFWFVMAFLISIIVIVMLDYYYHVDWDKILLVFEKFCNLFVKMLPKAQ